MSYDAKYALKNSVAVNFSVIHHRGDSLKKQNHGRLLSIYFDGKYRNRLNKG